MHEIFPPALVDCLKSGEPPSDNQLHAVALHVWRDWCAGFGFACRGMPRDPALAAHIRSIARVALNGQGDGPPPDTSSEARLAPSPNRRILDIAC